MKNQTNTDGAASPNPQLMVDPVSQDAGGQGQAAATTSTSSVPPIIVDQNTPESPVIPASVKGPHV